MIVKLNKKQYNFLLKHLSKEKFDLFEFFKFGEGLKFEISEDIAEKVRDWAGEKLQKEGFDIDYNVNETGKILEQFQDLFYN